MTTKTQELIDYLNELVALDKYSIAELICCDVVCDKALLDHPTLPVSVSGSTYHKPGTYRLNFLGVLNGFCGLNANGLPPIIAEYQNGQLIGFKQR